MQRWKPLLAAALALVAMGVVIWKVRGPSGQSSTPPRASASPTPSAAAPPVAMASASEPDKPVELPSPSLSAAPPLPEGAPKVVRFGVILIKYAGAELAPADAPSKDKAYEKAKQLLVEAKAGFEEAVKKGDPGSRTDAGRIPRGVLEPAIEYALFTLKKGEVSSEPVDTPRGFWVVRRND